MRSLHILGFGSGDKGEITLRTIDLLKESDAVFVRTTRHPAASILKEYNIPYRSFDDAYEEFDTFEELYEHIADTILASPEDHVSYIVPGSAVFAERAVQLLLKKTTCEVQMIPAVSFLDAIFASLKQDALNSFKLIDALSLDEQAPDVSCMNIVCQVYDKQVASDVKLSLMRYYKDETPVILISGAATEEEHISEMPLYAIDHADHIDHLTSLIIPAQTYDSAPSAFSSLCEIVSILRGENGCPWDKAQTHESLLPYLIEESYEAVDAAKLGDDENFCEELGDVLLQVMLHAQIAKEEHAFDIYDVIRSVSEKMIRRHPHVFAESATEEDINIIWERVKETEKEHKSVSDKMDAVAQSLPSLIYADKIQAKAAKTGFDFKTANAAFDKISEETEELREALYADQKERILEEGGDLLFAVVNVLRLCGLDAEEALRAAISKFIKRFRIMEQHITNAGKVLANLSLEEMDNYWNISKNL